MNATKLIGIILIIASVSLGYIGFNKIADNTKEVNFLGIKINASNESGQQQGYMYVGAALLFFVGGIYCLKSKSN